MLFFSASLLLRVSSSLLLFVLHPFRSYFFLPSFLLSLFSRFFVLLFFFSHSCVFSFPSLIVSRLHSLSLRSSSILSLYVRFFLQKKRNKHAFAVFQDSRSVSNCWLPTNRSRSSDENFWQGKSHIPLHGTAASAASARALWISKAPGSRRLAFSLQGNNRRNGAKQLGWSLDPNRPNEARS